MNQITKPTALFSISSLGLGHVTRTLSIIETYLTTHNIHIVCTGNALAYLKEELRTQNQNVVFHDLKDYPPLERGKGFLFYLYLIIDSLQTIWVIKQERRFMKKLCRLIHPQFIVSDGRYGSYIKKIPSFIISHQISFVMPKGFGLFQGIADYFNYRTFKKFDEVFIPDYENSQVNLAGKLSHNVMLSKLKHTYVGILSSLKKKTIGKDIDFLFAVSGYLEEHKANFISILFEHAKNLPGKKVFVLGNARGGSQKTDSEHQIEIYPSVSGEQRQEFYNRAKFVVSRSGYTTIMDLVELGIPGFLIPTPGQTEQEYLAHYVGNNKFFLVPGTGLDLSVLGTRGEALSFKAPWTTQTSVEIVRKRIIERVSRGS